MKATCDVCCHKCVLKEGQTGLCHARRNTDGVVKSVNYGKLTAIALDPIEKKPLSMFMPGSRILSVGSYGCSLRCPFCQNWQISLAGMPVYQPGDKEERRRKCRELRDGTARGETGGRGRAECVTEGSVIPRAAAVSPQELCSMAAKMRRRGNIGVAYTYNEPLVGWEYVMDTAMLVHAAAMKNVLVSNGMAELTVLDKLLPYMDAMNIDLKSFSKDVYADVLGGDRDMVMRFIERAVCFRNEAGGGVHVEITSLIVPGINDSVDEVRQLSNWIASLDGGRGKNIPLHITRYFPGYKMKTPATDVKLIRRLAEEAGRQLRNVFTGNI